jgi:uncharacterized protein YoxC
MIQLIFKFLIKEKKQLPLVRKLSFPYETDLTNLTPRIEELESFTQQINDGVVELSEKIEELVDDLGQLETAVIGINNRVKTLEERSNNLITFHQSIIDNIIMANPYGNLYDKIISEQMYHTTIKTLLGDNIYPRTTNTILTIYYSSYIDTIFPKDTITTANNNMFTFYSNSSTSTILMISIINSTKGRT